VVLIVRGQEYIQPTGDTPIQAEDEIFALVKDIGEAALRGTILGETSS
jgi:Trk K+ transport system NAD-binding subunit